MLRPRSSTGTFSHHAPVSAALILGSLERRHHVLGEPPELLLELGRAQALGPVDHEVLEARILRLDRLDALDDVLGRPAEPRLLRDAVGKLRRARRGAGRAPGAALLVGIAHEPEWREPLVALVVRGLDLSDRLGFRVGEIEPCAPDHVLAELLFPAVLVAGRRVGAGDRREALSPGWRHQPA